MKAARRPKTVRQAARESAAKFIASHPVLPELALFAVLVALLLGGAL